METEGLVSVVVDLRWAVGKWNCRSRVGSENEPLTNVHEHGPCSLQLRLNGPQLYDVGVVKAPGQTWQVTRSVLDDHEENIRPQLRFTSP